MICRKVRIEQYKQTDRETFFVHYRQTDTFSSLTGGSNWPFRCLDNLTEEAKASLQPARPSGLDRGAGIQFKRVHFGVLLCASRARLGLGAPGGPQLTFLTWLEKVLILCYKQLLRGVPTGKWGWQMSEFGGCKCPPDKYVLGVQG